MQQPQHITTNTHCALQDREAATYICAQHFSRNQTFAAACITLFDAQRSTTHAHTTGINRLNMKSVRICGETRSCWSPCRIISSRVHAGASTSSVLLSSSPPLLPSSFHAGQKDSSAGKEKRGSSLRRSLFSVSSSLSLDSEKIFKGIQRKSKCLNSSSRTVRTGGRVLD